jgi:hypothetical protein
MGLSPGLALIAHLRRAALLVRSGPVPAAGPAAGLPPARPLGHAFAEGGSPVLFAEMPLDNRTVNISAALAAISGLFRPPETPPPARRLNLSLDPTVL